MIWQWLDLQVRVLRRVTLFRKATNALLLILVAGSAFATEHDLGVGYEPVVSADRVTTSNDATKRVQVVWTTADHILRTYSSDLAGTWTDSVAFGENFHENIDPVAACNIFGTQSPRHMYFGWYTQIGLTDVGTWFNRSISGANVDNTLLAEPQTPGLKTDRPWLVCNTTSLFLSYSNTQVGTNPLPYVKRAAMPSGTGTISWTASAVQVNPISGTAFVGSFPMATYVDSNGAESVYTIAQQYTEQFPPSTLNKNTIRIWKSTNAGSSWSSDLLGINVDSFDGYVKTRDYPMLTYHVSKDPAASSGKLYAFYVRNDIRRHLLWPQNIVHWTKGEAL